MMIRLAAPEDARGIAQVQVESWNTTYPGIVPKSYLDSLDIKKREKIWKQAAALCCRARRRNCRLRHRRRKQR